jgi:putative Mn2+ efflux pump MntP
VIGKLVAFVLPLGLDSFAVAAAIGASGQLTAAARWRVSVLFLVFEAGMPLVGVAVGAPLGRVVGRTADYLAAAAVIAIGAWILLHGDADDEQHSAGNLITARGTALLALGISISLDELAIGFSLGLSRLPVIPVIAAIGAQAFLAAQLGMLLGGRIAARYGEAAERVAGIALIALGVYLALQRLLG